ncbi:MAG: M23 family metallopeptidase [Oscillibacter sp.]|nr:M23 family metallopeptidase [Oscillibacter sp.]
MEQPKNEKPKNGQSVAFYTALAVCLIAVGVGTWQLLRPETDTPAVSLPGEVSARPEIPVTGEAALPVEVPDEEAPAEDVSTLKPAKSPDESDASGDSKSSSDASSASDGGKSSSDTSSGSKSSSSGGKSSSGASSGNKSSSGGGKSSSGTSGASDSKKPASGGGTRPVEGTTVTGFSMDKLLYNETMRDWRTHDGIDIAAEAGTAVAAAKAGTVESVEADPIMGMTVVIRHEDKYETVYSSLTDMPEVEAGDSVSAGQVIGYVGESAASESALGPHLHFSVLNGGTPVDPETFLA